MTAITDSGVSRQGLAGRWGMPLAQLSLVFAAICLVYWRTAWTMVETWARSETFTHGFLVLPIVLWLVWRRRWEAAALHPYPSFSARLLLALAGIFWLVGDLASVNAVTQLALVALLALTVPALLGWAVARTFAFPLAFLFFAVPTGEFLLPVLMDWTTHFAVLGLRLSGVPVYRDGLEMVIPTGNWSVVEACSGIRYLIASLMAGTLFAYLNYRSLFRRLAFVGVSLVVPLVANWVRAYGVIMLGHLSGNRLATGVDHLIYGWLFFGLVIMVMFAIGARWAEPDGPESLETPYSAQGIPGERLDWGAAGLAAMLASWPVLASEGFDYLNEAGPARLERAVEPFAWRGWQAVPGTGASLPDWRPEYRDAMDTWQPVFRRGGREVGVYIGYYRNQGYDRKMVASTNTLVRSDNRDWALKDLDDVPLSLGGQDWRAGAAEVRRRTGTNAGQRLLVWHWYWVAGRMTGHPRQAKLETAWSRLLGKGDDSAVIVLYTAADRPGAAADLEAFSQSAGIAIQELLNDTRKQP